MIFDDVTAQEEAVVLQDVGQPERQRPGGDGAGDDPARAGAGQQRADRQAQLIEQAGRDQLAQQLRAAFGEQPPVTAIGERVHRCVQVHGLPAGHDDIGALGQLGAALGRRCGGGDDDRAGVRRGRRDEPARRIEVEPGADHRDRRCRRPAFPQVVPELAAADRGVALGPHRRGAGHDDVGQRAEQGEYVPIAARR